MNLDEFRERYTTSVTESGCWIWTGRIHTNGYGVIDQKRNGRNRIIRAHRLAYEIAHGEIPAGKHICHKCDVRLCVNPFHLFAGTRSDNMRDCVAKGRHVTQVKPDSLPRGQHHWSAHKPDKIVYGEHHGMSKLTDDLVRRIRADNRIAKLVATDFGISKSLVYQVKARTIWTRVS